MRDMSVNGASGRARRPVRGRHQRWTRIDRRRSQLRHEALRTVDGCSFTLPDEGTTLLLADGKITAVPVEGADPFYVITNDV